MPELNEMQIVLNTEAANAEAMSMKKIKTMYQDYKALRFL